MMKRHISLAVLFILSFWYATAFSWGWGGGGGRPLPDQTGNGGKYLKTDGSDTSWDTPSGGGGSTTSLPWDNITSRPTINGVTVTGSVLDNEANYPIFLLNKLTPSGLGGRIVTSTGGPGTPGWSAYSLVGYDNQVYTFPETTATLLATTGSGANLSALPSSTGLYPTLNQNTTGTAAGLAAAYIDWNASSGGASILNKPTLGGLSSLDNGANIDIAGNAATATALAANPADCSGGQYATGIAANGDLTCGTPAAGSGNPPMPTIGAATRNLRVMPNSADNTVHLHKVDITADNVYLFNSAGTAVKFNSVSTSIDLAVSGLGGIDNTSEGASRWYYGYLVGADNGAVGGVWSESYTLPSLPSGYNYFLRVTASYNNSSSNFREYVQVGENIRIWDRALSGGTQTSITSFSIATCVPPMAVAKHIYVNPNIVHSGGSATASVYIYPRYPDLNGGDGNLDYGAGEVAYNTYVPAGNGPSVGSFKIPHLTEQTLYYQVDSSNTAYYADMRGFDLE
jgi:hypothetical protein